MQTSSHSKTSNTRVGEDTSPQLYRSRSGMIAGVCRGFAEWRDIPVGLVRVLVVILALLTQIFPVIVGYIILALVMKPKPVMPIQSESDQEFYDSYTNSKSAAIKRVRSVIDGLERRTTRLEEAAIDKEREWDRRFRA